MSGFDIATLPHFQPARWLCAKCNGLLFRPPDLKCSVCGVLYAGHQSSDHTVASFLQAVGRRLDFHELIAHGLDLARAVQPLGGEEVDVPPLRVLFDVLMRAKKFVHFASWNLSWELLGALALVARRVPVRGVVTKVDDRTIGIAKSLRMGAPWLDIRRYPRKLKWEGPHQKIIIVDGLLAVKGSANLTLNSWLPAAGDGREIHNEIEAVTELDRVVDLHNRLFARLWASLSDVQEPIIDYYRIGQDWRYLFHQPPTESPGRIAPQEQLWLGQHWKHLVALIEVTSRVTAGNLKESVAWLDGDLLIVKFPPDRRFEMESMDKDGRADRVLQAAQKYIGKAVQRVSFEQSAGRFDDEPPF